MAYDDMMKKALEALRFRSPVEPDLGQMREAVRRGGAAQRLLDDSDLTTAFSTVEDVYMRAWKGSDAHDTPTRERCHVAISILADLRNYLRAAVENGDAAAREMEKFAKR